MIVKKKGEARKAKNKKTRKQENQKTRKQNKKKRLDTLVILETLDLVH